MGADTRFGSNILTKVVDSTAMYISQGKIWRVGTDYISLANTVYATINFTTPAKGLVIYPFLDVAKSGDELVLNLFEGGTYSAGTASTLTPLNLNRNSTLTNPFGIIRLGISTTTTTTITGGTVFPDALVPGSAGGNTKPGSSSSGGKTIYLKPNQNYTVKMLSKGNNGVTMAAVLDLLYEPDA